MTIHELLNIRLDANSVTDMLQYLRDYVLTGKGYWNTFVGKKSGMLGSPENFRV